MSCAGHGSACQSLQAASQGQRISLRQKTFRSKAAARAPKSWAVGEAEEYPDYHHGRPNAGEEDDSLFLLNLDLQFSAKMVLVERIFADLMDRRMQFRTLP